MKNLILLPTLLLTLNVFGINQTNVTELTTPKVFLSQNYYAVTGYTRNEFGQNYSVNLRIYGSSNPYSNYISSVEYNDGRNWVKVLHQKDFYSDSTYYVFINSQRFYFEF